MIPVKLKMRNFMCYRGDVPPLLLDGIHTACICGDNGNGKSTLIDAMTWALWGKARARSDDDLIHLGQTEMEVEFDFTVSQQLYRIIRKRSRPKGGRGAGRTILEFQVASGDDYRSITGDSIAQTQHKIIDILHMDYETFTNSVFLRQGHADEFTVKRPADRKQVLADILGLSFYDELEERAKGLARQQETEKTQLDSTLKDIGDELARKPVYEVSFEEARTELSRIEKTTREQESRLNGLRQEKESLENRRAQLTQLEEHIANTERDLERWNDQVRQHNSQIKEYEDLIACRSAIEEGYAQFSEARQLCDELEGRFRQSVNLEKQKSQLDSKIREAGQSLITGHALIQSRIKELGANSQKLPQLKNELQQAQVELGRVAGEEKTLVVKRQTSQELQAQVHHLETSKTRLEQEINEIEEKLDLLSTQTEAKCPLCERELEIEGLKLIEAKYADEKQNKSSSLKLNQVELDKKRIELKSLENEVFQLEARLKQEIASAQSKASILGQSIAEAEGAGNKLNEEKNRLAEIEEHLAAKDFATAEQKALVGVEWELAELGYDAQQHEAVRQRLINLQRYEEPRRRLEEADRLLNQKKEAVSRAEEAALELRRSLEADNQKKQSLSEELDQLPQVAGDLIQAGSEYQELAKQQKQAQEIMWQVRVKLERCAELEIRKGEKEKLLARVSREEQIYRDLAQAFGKRGVQALLIEIALPEIETEADRLLGRMTDNRMHIKIETQRQTRKGDLMETLDINISDELGTRDYEMFSGGEAFRINFAIRIALSKLLAKRAGAPLPTLVIDEGFGTQDSTGIEKIKEAINSIQDDFDKILVITHIEEIRDAFPNRIDVIKTAEGSTLEVS
ncbi:SMC family ATPase [Chloroflexota bacterium]